MGHPGSQLADGLHPLGKPQLVFQQISQKKSGSSAITADRPSATENWMFRA